MRLWYSLLDTVTAESNGSEGMESLEDDQMSEEMLALVDEFENSWPQEAFEGALEVKGRRMDLQGIRVLKKGAQDGLASSCFGDCGDDDEAEWVSLDEFVKVSYQLTVTEGKTRTVSGNFPCGLQRAGLWFMWNEQLISVHSKGKASTKTYIIDYQQQALGCWMLLGASMLPVQSYKGDKILTKCSS